MKKTILLAASLLAASAAVAPRGRAAAPPDERRRIDSGAAEDAPVQVAYYYKVRWGFQQEFERLFLKNHYPVLMETKQRGRVQDVKMFRPTYHLKDDWTFLVVITYPSWTAFGSPSDEEAISRKLYPDHERFQKEEQRRFEILDSHWDVPLTAVAAPK